MLAPTFVEQIGNCVLFYTEMNEILLNIIFKKYIFDSKTKKNQANKSVFSDNTLHGKV